MLDNTTKRRIDTARNILVGKVPDPKSQVEQITIALIYKFMDDMDLETEELGGEPSFFSGDFNKFGWRKIFNPGLGGFEMLSLYSEAIMKMSQNPNIPKLFRDIFKNAFLPYRDPETLKSFLKVIDDFNYDNSEKLGDAFEYLLSVLGSQGDAGQFRTPRHIIDFMTALIAPKKNETILDPACGTAGFLISAYKHIFKYNSSNFDKSDPYTFEQNNVKLAEITVNGKHYNGDKILPEERAQIINSIKGYDISPDMVRLSIVNLYLHGFTNPQILEYDTLTSEERWNEYFDVILANPPFMSPKGGIRPHKRFAIQSKRSEVLFVDYMAEHLTANGRAAIIVPEGIIFQSGTAYKSLRKMLIEDNFLVGVISLPSGVFNPYSGVKTSILWLDKSLATKTDKILFAKIENDGFDLGAQRRPVDKNDLPEVFRKLTEYRDKLMQGEEIQFDNHKLITSTEKEKIAENTYNLTGDRYREVVDYSNAKWDMVELGEVCDLIRGITYKKDDEVKENGFKVLRANNIDLDSSLNLEDVKHISSNLDLKDNKKLRKDDIFICLASGSKAHIGKVAFIEKNTDFYFGGFMGAIRLNQDKKALSQYIFQQLKSSKFNDFLRKEISGVNINNLNSKILSRYKIPLPPLEVQEQIVAEIERYQKVIDGAKQVVENWKPSFRIDPSWEMVELGEVCEVTSSKRIYKDEYVDNGIPFYRTKEIVELSQNKEISLELFISNEKYKEIEEKFGVPKKNDILISAVGTLGISWVISDNRQFYFKDGNLIWMKKLNYEISSVFLKNMLDIFVKNNIAGISNGAAYKALTIVNLKKLKIPSPPLSVQEQIVAEIEAEQKIVHANKELMEKMEQKVEAKIGEVWGDER